MFFRFGAAIFLAVCLALVGITIEKRNLSLRRESTLLIFRQEQLENQHRQLRLRVQELSAPTELDRHVPK